MMVKKHSQITIFLLFVSSAFAYSTNLDTNWSVNTGGINYDSPLKPKDNLIKNSGEQLKFEERTHDIKSCRFGIHGGFTMQRISIRKHSVLEPTKAFFVNGLSFGIQYRLGNSFTVGAGLTFMGNNSRTPSSLNGFAETRAGDSLKIIPAEILAYNETNVYAPYLVGCYKFLLKNKLTLEPSLRISFNQVYVSHNSSYLLVAKNNNYNEIVSTFGYESLSLAIQPGLGIGYSLNKHFKLIAQTYYSIHTLQDKSYYYEQKLLNVTPSNNSDIIEQYYERPETKNGVGGYIGILVFF